MVRNFRDFLFKGSIPKYRKYSGNYKVMNDLKKQFHHTVQAETRLITSLCKKVSPRFSEKNIHKLRTTVKKLRALLRWQGVADKVFTKSFKELYRAAGNIRDGQVLLKRLSKEKDVSPAFLSWLTGHIAQAQKKWEEVYDKDKIEAWEKEALALKIKIRVTTPRDFYKKKMDVLHQKNITPITDDILHRERKAVKDMRYVVEWYEQNAARKKSRSAPVKSLKLLGRKAGDYMDQFSGLKLLNVYLRREKNPDAAAAGRGLRSCWQKQKRTKKRELLNELRTFDKDQSPQ